MTVRLNTLTALEQADAEDAARMPITVLEDDKAPKVRIYVALAWVHRRRGNPTLTYQQHLETCRFGDEVRYLFGEEGDDVAADDGAEVDDVTAPFPESGEGPGPADAGGSAEAEGAVLSVDGDLAV